MDSSSSSNMMAGAPLVNLTIDAASMGCRNKSGWMQAQVDTWGASNVHFFFGSTEQDDIDPTCNEVMKPKLSMLAKAFFAQPKWLEKTNTGIGWLCAQQSFASMLGKVGKFYQIQLEVDKSFQLPSFLLIQDDDTYYNMDVLERELLLKVKDLFIPFAAAGCLVNMPIHMLNFSFPAVRRVRNNIEPGSDNETYSAHILQQINAWWIKKKCRQFFFWVSCLRYYPERYIWRETSISKRNVNIRSYASSCCVEPIPRLHA